MGVPIVYVGDDGKEHRLDNLFVQDVAATAIQVILYPHSAIHGGYSFMIKDYLDLATDAVSDIRITTSNTTKWIHLLPTFGSETEYRYQIYEDAVITVAGAAVTPRNRNRNFPDNSSLAVDTIDNASLALANDDTNITDATLIYNGVTGPTHKEGGGDRGADEITLKQNTIYTLRLTCVSAGWADILINWYELTNKT